MGGGAAGLISRLSPVSSGAAHPHIRIVCSGAQPPRSRRNPSKFPPAGKEPSASAFRKGLHQFVSCPLALPPQGESRTFNGPASEGSVQRPRGSLSRFSKASSTRSPRTLPFDVASLILLFTNKGEGNLRGYLPGKENPCLYRPDMVEFLKHTNALSLL